MDTVTPIRQPLRIVYGKSQSSVETHMIEAGWQIIWRNGEPTTKEPNGETLDDGAIKGKNAQIARIRSAEIPWRVSIGSFDIGIVGTDCLLDHLDENSVRINGGYAYGRTRGQALPFLGVFARESSLFSTWDDVPNGTTIITERPHLTKDEAEKNGRAAEIFWGDERNYLKFQNEMADKGKLAIKIIEGAGAQQLQDDELLVMVGETGRRQRNYDLKEISRICDVETLILVNIESMRRPAIFREIQQFMRDLDRVTVKLESDSIRSVEKESIVVPRHLSSGERSA